MAEGDGIELNAGAARVRAYGETTIQVLLTIAVIAAIFYMVVITNQQTMIIQAEHAAHLVSLKQDHREITATLRDLTAANENVFLSSMLPNERKRELPAYIQDKARAIVEKRAENLTENHR